MRHLCTFDLPGNRYAVEMQHLRQVIDALPMTPVPLAPEEILGIVNYRGDLITVYSIDVLVGVLQSAGEYERPLMLLLEALPHRFAIAVERIETITVEAETIHRVEDTNGIVRAMIPGEPNPVLILDVESLVNRLESSFSKPVSTASLPS